jgi:curli biogenesis system outer membrane secretion channel CsgG
MLIMRKIVCCLLVLGCAVPLGYGQAAKKRIAVMNFEYGTVQSYVAEIFGADQDVGKGIADLLVNQLVNDQVYSVIERKDLDKIITEQNFSNSDRANPATAAKIGRVLGVDAILIGSITQFGRDDKREGLGGNAYGLGKYGLGNIGRKKSKAVVVISGRMVDVNTGEVLAVAQGQGESERSGMLLGGGGGGWSGGGGGQLDMSSSNFGATILGEAVNQAVNNMAKDLESKVGTLPTNVVHFSGLVAYFSGGQMVVNFGAKAGVHVGDTLQISRVGQVIKDPATGKVIKKIELPLGEMKVTEVDSDSATGTFSGTGAPKVGDSADGSH